MENLSKKNNILQNLSDIGLQRILAPAALVLLYIFFGLFGRNFFSYDTMVNIFDSSYYIGFIAIGVTFVIISGGIDLSVGTVMMCSAIIGGTAYKTWGWPMWISLLLILAVGIAFGFINGLLVSRLKLPPFIATLGTMMISMGVGSIVANVRSATFPTRASEDGWFKSIFKYIGDDGFSIPTGAFVLFGVAFIAFIILTKTKMGRYIFAIGSNKEAARLSGVDVKKWEMMAYVVAGATAGIGGISFAAVYTTVMPAQGQGFELYAIAGAVIGGTSLSGGIGTVFGTLIGVYIMSVLRAGLPSMDLQAHYQTFFTGVVVIVAVLLDIYRTQKASVIKIATPSKE
jgi:ribose transport system permease protein